MNEHLNQLCKCGPLNYEPGIYLDVTRDAYDSIPAYSATVIKKWMRLGSVPEDFGYWLKTRWNEEPGEAKILGSALRLPA